jgi:hypothetical protein
MLIVAVLCEIGRHGVRATSLSRHSKEQGCGEHCSGSMRKTSWDHGFVVDVDVDGDRLGWLKLRSGVAIEFLLGAGIVEFLCEFIKMMKLFDLVDKSSVVVVAVEGLLLMS